MRALSLSDCIRDYSEDTLDATPCHFSAAKQTRLSSQLVFQTLELN